MTDKYTPEEKAASYRRMHVEAVDRYARLTMEVMILASEGKWEKVVQAVADSCDACDCVSEAFWQTFALALEKAKESERRCESGQIEGQGALL